MRILFLVTLIGENTILNYNLLEPKNFIQQYALPDKLFEFIQVALQLKWQKLSKGMIVVLFLIHLSRKISQKRLINCLLVILLNIKIMLLKL